MTDRDLTPAEARAEVEAFFGEGWIAKAATDGLTCVVSARHYPSDIVLNALDHRTFRAAVDALLQAWRDAVRPWVREAIQRADETHEENITQAQVEARVLKEDSNG